MKKLSKKVLALILAFVMAVGVVPNVFPVAEEVKASEEAAEEYDYSLEIAHKESATSLVNKLKDKFKLYNYNENNELVAGPTTPSFVTSEDNVNTNVTAGATRTFGDTSNGYLKFWQKINNTNYPNVANKWSGQVGTMTYMERTYENFKAEFSFFPGTQISGLSFGGGVDAFPVTADNDNSNDIGVMVFMERNGYLNIAGSIQPETASYTWGTTTGTDFQTHSYFGSKMANIRSNQSLTGKTTSLVSTIASDSTDYYTIVITVKQGILTVYEKSNPQNVVTVKLASTYRAGYVSLFVNNFRYSSYKSFKISAIENVPTYDVDYTFEGADLSTMNLTSTQFSSSSPYGVIEGTLDKPISSHWTTAVKSTTYPNNGLKVTSHSNAKRYSMVPIISGCKDFEMSVEVYAASGYGVAIGNKNVFPGVGTNEGTRIRFDGGYMRITGNFVASTLAVKGSTYAYGWNTDLTGKDLNFNPRYTNTGTNFYLQKQLETLNIKVVDNVLTLWLGTEITSDTTVLTISMQNLNTDGTISLFGQYYDLGGGFKSVKLRKIENDSNAMKFDNLDITTLSDWSSMIYNTSTKEKTMADSITEQWFTGKENYPSTEEGWNGGWNSFKNSGLKPLAVNPSNQVTVLSSPDTYENFESSFTYYQNSMAYGMVFGESGVYPQEVVDAGVRVYIQSTEYGKFLRVVGAVDSNSAVNVGKVEGEITQHRDYVEMNLSKLGFSTAAASSTATVTIYAKVENGQVTVSVDGIEAAMTVNLTGNYVYGPISLFATGCAHGGFKKLEVNTLDANETVESTDIGFNVQVQGDYTAVTMSSEQAYSVINGNVKFDTSLYEYVVAIFGTRSVMVNDNKFFTPEEDTLPIDIIYNGDEEDQVVTLYFKNLSNTYDYSNLAFEDLQVIVSGGDEVATVNQTITVTDDYTGDMKVNIVDLVKGKKEGKTLTTLRKSLVGLADESVSPLVGKSLLFLGDSIAKGAGDQYWMSWAARIGREGVLYDNVGQSGWTLTNTATSGQGQIVTQLDKASREEYDFVLLEGGVNDVRIYFGQDERWGEIEYDLDVTEYDTSTIAGAMQDLIVKTQNKFGTAKILWVINSYFSISSQEMTYSEHMERYVPFVKAICDLHGIEYIDLNDTETYPELVAVSNKNPDLYTEYLPDKLHPNAASYELTTPYVVKKMEEMLLVDK